MIQRKRRGPPPGLWHMVGIAGLYDGPSLATSRNTMGLAELSDPEDVLEPRHQQLSGEVKLLCAVLECAIEDFVRGDETYALWHTAREYIFEGLGRGPCTFETACAVLDMDVEKARAMVLARRTAPAVRRAS